MNIRAGQTFLYPLGQHLTAHLWIVSTNPDSDGNVAVVSLTSLRGNKDQTVILQAGEHPFVRWQTCIYYKESKILSVEKIADLIACGDAESREEMPPKLLAEILAGFTASQFTSNRVRQFIAAATGRAAGRY